VGRLPGFRMICMVVGGWEVVDDVWMVVVFEQFLNS